MGRTMRAAAALLFAAAAAFGQARGLADERFTSNAYTQPEPAAGAAAPASLPASFRRAAVSPALELWVDPAGLSLAVVDRRVPTAWRSSPVVPASEDLNDTWRANFASGVLVEYVDPGDVLVTESAAGAAVTLRDAPGGFDAALSFPSGVTLLVQVRLEGDSLLLRVPSASLREGDNRLVSIRLLPFLGATRGAEVPGYIFIPDGSGALMRFRAPDTRTGAAWSQPVYGVDEGVSGPPRGDTGLVRTAPRVTLPVYGIARPAGTAAFVAAVEKGAEYAVLDATPSGTVTAWSWAAARFVYRRQFFQPTSRALGGITVFQKERASFDAEVRWMFLAGTAADYVGMARRYQDRLVARGLLARGGVDPARDVPVLLTALAADWKPGLLVRRRVVPATTAADLARIAGDLRGAGVSHAVVVYRGYQAGGAGGAYPARFPVERAVGGMAGVEAAAGSLRAAGAVFGLESSLVDAFAGARGYSVRTDVARQVNGQPLQDATLFLLGPRAALRLAESDARAFPARGVAAVALDWHTTQRLWSDGASGAARDLAAAQRAAAVGVLRAAGLRTVLEAPNEFLLPQADMVSRVPRYSSGHAFETDTVPFVSIVLAGYRELFAEETNFMSDPAEGLLRSLEYGAAPSFLLTAVPSRALIETGSDWMISTRYDDWRATILAQYAKANEALRAVRGMRIEGRRVPRPGVVVVTWEGGTRLVVNYTDAPWTGEGVTAGPRGFAVAGGGAHASAR